MLGLFGLKAGVGAGLHLGLGALELGFALLPALDFGGDGAAVLQGRRVSLVGLGQQLGDLEVEGAQGFFGVAVADGGVLARVGEDFGAVDGHGDVPDLEHAAAGGQLEDLREGVREERAVVAPERAERVVIGVGVGAQEAHRDVFVGGALDLAAGERARGVAVDEQPEQHRRRILFAAGAAGVDRGRARVDGLHRIDHEMHKVIRRHPVAQVGRQEQRGVAVDIHVAGHIRMRSNY